MSVTLCLGEALVDMIGEAPAPSVSAVERFEPHFGGATANVAVFAARTGAQVSLAGAAGEDRWGRWLASVWRPKRSTRPISRSSRASTPSWHSCRSTSMASRPTSSTGELVEPLVDALHGRIDEAVDASAGLFISSNTLAGAGERALTMRARERALERSRPVVFDCNLRLHRWSSRADAAASANACIPGAMMVRANRDEAEVLTGESDPERAAMALRKAGAELVVITLGSGGAILRGDGLRADVPAVTPARVAQHGRSGRRPHRDAARPPRPERLLSAGRGRRARRGGRGGRRGV